MKLEHLDSRIRKIGLRLHKNGVVDVYANGVLFKRIRPEVSIGTPLTPKKVKTKCSS